MNEKHFHVSRIYTLSSDTFSTVKHVRTEEYSKKWYNITMWAHDIEWLLHKVVEE